jgi:hypothetical protein
MRFLGCPVPRPSAQCAGSFSFPLFFSFTNSHSLTCTPPARSFATRRLCRVPPRHASVTRRHLATRCLLRCLDITVLGSDLR